MAEPKIDSSDFAKSVDAYLKRLENGAIQAIAEAANDTRTEAIKETPVDTGTLRAGWQIKQGRDGNTTWTETYNAVPYAAAVEYGTRSHTITARNKKVLANKKTGQVFGTKVRHPGTKPRRMLKKAIDRVVPQLRARLGRIN